MKTVRRYDIIKLDKITKTPQGFLRIPVTAARTGIQLYRDGDGNTIREFRPKEEVFKDRAMSSLAGAPVTDDHPKEMVTAENSRDLMRGFVSDSVHNRDDRFLESEAIITDSVLIKKILKGKQEVSMGYDVELEFTPGEHGGQAFDAIQRNIVHNHLAVVDRGRAGPQVKLRLDSSDAVMITDNKDNNPNGDPMKIKIGDKEFEVSNTELAEAVKGLVKNDSEKADKIKTLEDEAKKAPKGDAEAKEVQKKLDEQTSTNEKLQAKNDALAADLKKAEKGDGKDPMDASKVSELVRERRKLEKVADRVLDEETVAKLDSMSDREVKEAIIKSDAKDADLEKKSDDYVDARYDHIAEGALKSGDANNKLGNLITNKRKADAQTDVEKKRAESQKADSDAWKKPVGVSKLA